MKEKLKTEDIIPGKVMETTFWINKVEDSGFHFKATHLDGKKAPKVVLCDDSRIRAGTPCIVRIVKMSKPGRSDRGIIEVEFVRNIEFNLEGVYLDPMEARKIQVLLESGLNILLDGPQGCGKTFLAGSIARSLGMEFVFFNCSAVVEATDFMATIQVRASDTGQPVTDFIKTDLLEGLESAINNPAKRYLIFMDEFNRCQESARNAVMPALDSTRKIFNPITNSFLEIPDNVQFIAAVNRGGEFSGTFGIDAAQLDRFAPMQMDYLPPDQEKDLLSRRHPELDPDIVSCIVDIAHAIRSDSSLPHGLSVRATDEACTYLKHPLMEADQQRMIAEVLKSSFCGRFPGRWKDFSSDAGMVWGIVKKRLSWNRSDDKLRPVDKDPE